MITSLDNLSDLQEDVEKIEVTAKTYKDISYDFSLPLDTRLKAVKMYHEDDIIEFSKRIVNIYSMSFSSVIQQYIIAICRLENIPLVIRLELAKDLAFCFDTEECFTPLSILLKDVIHDTSVTTVKKVESICVLMRWPSFKEKAASYFLEIINNNTIDCSMRYKIILTLRTTYDMRKVWVGNEEKLRIEEDYKYFDDIAMYSFLLNCDNVPNLRVLAGQSILVKKYTHDDVESILFSIANDESVDYNTRADATDVVLRYGTEEAKKIASELIQKLGKIGNAEVRTVYENAQNAHTESIEKSAIECYEKIAEILIVKKEGTQDAIDFDYVVAQLGDVSEEVKTTITRIDRDRAIYTKFNCTLKTALVVMYSFISRQEEFEFLKERLIEELHSSAGICSSGIFERIMNTVSGVIEDLNIKISFCDQIIANVSGRLNKMIRDIVDQPCLHANDEYFCDCKYKVCQFQKTPGRRSKHGKKFLPCNKCNLCLEKKCVHICGDNCNQDLAGDILAQMILPSNKHDERRQFLLFFRCALSDIIDEMKAEFLEYIDEPSFEMYMKRAIIYYEGEN